MFNKTIVEGMLGIVGLRQPLNPLYAILDSDNLSSLSGYFVTDIDNVKIEFFKDSQDYEAISDVDFNTLLKQKQKSAIVDVCNMVFNREDFQDRNLLFTNASNNVDPEVLIDGFVGDRINVKKEKNFAFEITRVILDFHSNFPNDIVLQLYNTGDPNPIQSKTITITEKHQVEQLDWVIDNSGDTYKGDYYLGYVKSATSPIPYKRNYENADVMSSVEGLSIDSIQVNGHTGNTLFDLLAQEGLSENIGINPDFLCYDDYTDFILQNKKLLAPAINLKMAILMLQTSTSTLRVNRDERVSTENVVRMMQTLNGTNQGEGKLMAPSLHGQLASSIITIQSEIKKLQKGYHGGRIMVATRG